MDYKLIENVLDQHIFKNLYNEWVEGNNIGWFFNRTTLIDSPKEEQDDEFMFTHNLYSNGNITSDLFSFILPLTLKVNYLVGKSNLLRIKANLYTNQGKNIYHAKHTDFPNLKDYKTAVFNFNTCNGGTLLYIDNKEINIPSKANSLLIFDGNIEHKGYTQTDSKNRVLINYDFN